MQTTSLEDVLEKIVEQDARYHRDAYLFLREALEHTQTMIGKKTHELRHITGQELLKGIREYALETFGPMTIEVFGEWGVRTCEDFGNMVFVMVEHNLLRKTEQDSPEDFKKGYSFEEAFRTPFLPSSRTQQKIEPEKVEVEKI